MKNLQLGVGKKGIKRMTNGSIIQYYMEDNL